jgi:hypothetical protein
MTVLPKKLLTVALLLIVAVPVFFSVAFVIQQKLIQNQMQERLEQASLQNISVPLSELNWVKKDKEALINGQLFDVKSFSISGNTITLKGLFDDVEDHLIAKLKNEVSQKKETGASSVQLKCIFLPLYTESISFSTQSNWTVFTTPFSHYSKFIPEVHLTSVAPPPKFC